MKNPKNPKRSRKRQGRLTSTALAESLSVRDRERRRGQKALAGASHRWRDGHNDLRPILSFDPEVPLDRIHVTGRAIRTAGEAQIRKVARSIEAFGYVEPIIVNPRYGLFHGETRLLAMAMRGEKTIPVIVVSGLSATQERLLKIALNRLPEGTKWNIEALGEELEELIELGAEVELSGFEPEEIDAVIAFDEVPSGIEQGPLAPVKDAIAISRPGDVWLVGRHRVAVGDCRDARLLDRLLGSTAIRLILTDVPYNTRVRRITSGSHREFAMASGEMSEEVFYAFNIEWMTLALRYLVDGGVFGTWIDGRGIRSILNAAAELGLSLLAFVTWAKTAQAMGSFYRSQTEFLPLLKKGRASHVNNIKLGKYGRTRSNLWSAPGASTFGSEARAGLKDHPTVKPARALLVDAIRDMTHLGDAVLDPFLGSGSTLIACELTHRVCLAVEIDPLYVDVALRRFAMETGGEAVLEETGETLSAVEARRARRNDDDVDITPRSTRPRSSHSRLLIAHASADGCDEPAGNGEGI